MRAIPKRPAAPATHTVQAPRQRVELTPTTPAAGARAPVPEQAADAPPATAAAPVVKAAAPPAATPETLPVRTPPPAPAITAFTPAGGPPGTIVQLSGRNLGGVSSIRFNGTSADFKSAGDGQLAAKVPAGATSGPITVVTAGGAVTSEGTFTVTAPADAVPTPAASAPAISGTNPGSGSPGQTVSIGGKFFTGATAVRFNGVNADFTVVSDAQITARVPSSATSGGVTVVTPNGTATSPAGFTVFSPAPAVTGLSPTSGAVGTIVQIGGSHLSGATAVRFNETNADFTVVSDGQITARVPDGAATGSVVVVTPQGTAKSPAPFTVTPAPPEIEGFSPGSGAPGTVVTIGGKNLSGATAVKFNGVAATFSVTSEGRLAATLPAGATSGPVSVTTPAGTATSSATFTVTSAPPEITAVSPGSGPVGSSITIGGHGFTGATAVKVNGVSAAFTVGSDGATITATVPAGATSGPVTVTTPGGTATSAAAFTVTH
jgi:hypothetical protein